MKHCIVYFLFPFLAYAQNQKGASPIANAQERIAKNTYAVVVGISDYQDKDIPDLRFADRDAEAFANFLRSQAGGSLDGDHLKLLTNSEATLGQFAAALDWLMEVTKEGDNAIVYFSGHGDVEKKTLTQPGYLLCWDAPSRVYMGGGAFALNMLQEVISTLSIQNKAKVVVITDACRSGTLAGSTIGGSQATAANLAKQYANEIKILSCQPNEYSIEGEQWGGGRGAFSFNLVDALYGLADGNNDLFVTLQELGRYLEDHVTAEVAPVSQVPMVIGNRTERLAAVDAGLLANLRTGKTNQVKMLSAVEMRGLEEDVLAEVDETVRELYRLYKQSLKDKTLLEPANTCANAYYERLLAEPQLALLHTTMTRNYAAALQDDAQQAMNIWMKADVLQLHCIGKSLRLEPIPRLLERAAELLGEKHYMYRQLQARKLMFEGILKGLGNTNPDEQLARRCLSLFRQSLVLEPESPHPWHLMGLTYANNLRKPDSAMVCAQEALKLAPNWVYPFANLGTTFNLIDDWENAQKALKAAESIDPNHPLVTNGWALWYAYQESPEDIEKGLSLFMKYKQENGPMYPCWYNDLATVMMSLGKFDEAMEELDKAMAMDSTNDAILTNIGMVYLLTASYDKALPYLKKSVELNPLDVAALNNLGMLYNYTEQFEEGEKVWQKVISLDSTFANGWNNLGYLYEKIGRFEEALVAYNKAVELDPDLWTSWLNLANLYHATGKDSLAEAALKKNVTLNPYEVENWLTAGQFYLKTNRPEAAEPFFIQATALDSTIAIPHKHLGVVYFRTGRPTAAQSSFQKALAIDPDFAPALLGMACLSMAEGKTTGAIAYVEQAIGKGIKFEQLQKDMDLAPLRATPEWKELMKNYFQDKFKD